MKNKRMTVALSALFVFLFLCGAGWFGSATVVIDTDTNHIYKQYSADAILREFAANGKAAREKYQGEPVLISGKVASVEKNGKSIVLTGQILNGQEMECDYEKELRSTALNYKSGDSIAFYGHLSVNIFTNAVSLKVDRFADIPVSATSSEMYYLLDGTSFDKRSATKVTLDNGGVEYYIPASWTRKEIQHSIKDENLGTMEGYQYVLNKLTPSDPVPESLFVCYFDNGTQLAYADDAKETELIGKAIVENILESVGSFPSKKVDTYYDTEYAYYTGVFKNALETGEGYRTEFIFQADGKDGMVVVLYVYREARHLSDVLFLMRFLEINN